MSRNNRRSTAALFPGSRLQPPERLRADMREEWRVILGRMPAGWFSVEHMPVLEEYVRNVCYVRNLAAWLDKVDPTNLAPADVPKYKFLMAQRARCTSMMALLANRLRLTVISQKDVRNSRAAFGTDRLSPAKPWDDDGDAPASRN